MLLPFFSGPRSMTITFADRLNARVRPLLYIGAVPDLAFSRLPTRPSGDGFVSRAPAILVSAKARGSWSVLLSPPFPSMFIPPLDRRSCGRHNMGEQHRLFLSTATYPAHRRPWPTSSVLRLCCTAFLINIAQISVNASIVSDSGGTCVCNSSDNCATDATYLSCVQEVKQDLITSTAAISALSSVLMGALANLPVGMAPGMGLNAYV